MLQLLKPRTFLKISTLLHPDPALWWASHSQVSSISSRLCCCEVLTVPTAPLGPWRAPLTTATPAMETSPSKEWPLWAAVCGSSVWLCSKRIRHSHSIFIFSSSAFLFFSLRPGNHLQPLTPTHTALERKFCSYSRSEPCGVDGRNRFGVLSLGGGVGDVTASGRLIKSRSINLSREKGLIGLFRGINRCLRTASWEGKCSLFFLNADNSWWWTGGSRLSPRPRFTCVAVWSVN